MVVRPTLFRRSMVWSVATKYPSREVLPVWLPWMKRGFPGMVCPVVWL